MGLSLVDEYGETPAENYPIPQRIVEKIQNVLEIESLVIKEGSKDPPSLPQEELDQRDKYWQDVNRTIIEMCDQRRVNLKIENHMPAVTKNYPKVNKSNLLKIIDAIKDPEMKDQRILIQGEGPKCGEYEL